MNIDEKDHLNDSGAIRDMSEKRTGSGLLLQVVVWLGVAVVLLSASLVGGKFKSVVFGVAGIAAVLLLIVMVTILIPACQRSLTYVNRVRVPFFHQGMRRVNLQQLSYFRIGHFARNVEVQTSDGETLRGWHLAPTRLAGRLVGSVGGEARDQAFDAALADRRDPAVLFLHGQAGTRGLTNRLETCRALASQLQAHVLMFDYRGFGDSTGSPTQAGLISDALAMWSWICARRRTSVLVYGQSLGAAVAVQLVLQLEATGSDGVLRGLVLDVPFSSAAAATLYHPVGLPIRLLPGAQTLLLRALVDRWESEAVISRVKCPLLIIGAGTDTMVGPEGAKRLYATASSSRAARADSTDFISEIVRLIFIHEATHSNTYCFDDWLSGLTKFLDDIGVVAASTGEAAVRVRRSA